MIWGYHYFRKHPHGGRVPKNSDNWEDRWGLMLTPGDEQFVWLHGHFNPAPWDIWVFPWMVVPPKHPNMIIFSRIFPWLLGKPTILGNTHMDFITPKSIWIPTKKSCSWKKKPAPRNGCAKSWFGPTLKMVWGIPSGFFSGFLSINQIHQKMQETNGEALLYFCQQASFWGHWGKLACFVGRPGPGGAWGAEEQIDWKGIFLSIVLRIHVKFPGSFSVVLFRWSYTWRSKPLFISTSSSFFGLLQ